MLIDYEDLIRRIQLLEDEVAKMKQTKESDWYDVHSICEKYHLPLHNIKDRQWRLRNKFPSYQDSVCCKVAFKGTEVEEWMKENISTGGANNNKFKKIYYD